MGLLDIGIGLAEKYGPSLLQGLGNLNRGGGSPMYPGGPMGFAAPAGGGALGMARGKKACFDPRTGMQVKCKSRRGRGLTGSDIRGAQKVARLVQAFGFRPKIKARKRRR